MNNINKNLIKLLIVILILIPLVSADISNDTDISDKSDKIPITYRTDVDQDYGFYRVRDITTHKSFPYNDNILTINIGDTVTWMNDATPDWPLTIVSEQGLWNNTSARLRWNYQKFSYTFNESGEYGVYIKEYPSEKQKIIVISTKNPISTVTISPTYIVVTDTPEDRAIPISTTPIPTKTPGFTIIIGIVTIMAIIIIYKLKK